MSGTVSSEDGYLDAPLYAPSKAQLAAEGAVRGAGTRIFETRGDGTKWEYVIDANGTQVGIMVGNVRDDFIAKGYTYSAQTGSWEAPRPALRPSEGLSSGDD